MIVEMTDHPALTFYYGPMGAGKSTFALQTHFNQTRQGRSGLLLTKLDRSGDARVTSRIGIESAAIDVGGDDVYEIFSRHHYVQQLDFVVCDEAQFLTPAQVENLTRIVDDDRVDVFAYGLLTDFRSVLFPGSARLMELPTSRIECRRWCCAGAGERLS